VILVSQRKKQTTNAILVIYISYFYFDLKIYGGFMKFPKILPIHNLVKLISLTILILFLSTTVNAQTEREKSLINACKVLPLHSELSGYSSPKALIGFGTPVDVNSFEKFIKILIVQEECDPTIDECALEPEKPPEYEEIPTWANVDVLSQSGYVPLRCLVTKDVFKRQAPASALKKATVAELKGGSRGFSEEEDGDLVAMRGAGGKAQGGKANYQRLDKILKQAPEYNPQPVLLEFRKQGMLGEFK
jgi:hypothetical protein